MTPVKHDVNGDPFLFERFDMGAWVEILDPDTRDTDASRTTVVHVPGYYTGAWFNGSPVLDPDRLSDPQPHEIPLGVYPPVEMPPEEVHLP